MATEHGTPVWYELSTPDLAGAAEFYGALLGWTMRDAGMEGFTYHLASQGEAMVAGMMEPFAGVPPNWLIYFASTNADATVAATEAAGGAVLQPAGDIPDTGRFAILADPQGAAFGILQPLNGDMGSAFDQQKTGHGNWHELATTDPEAGLAFYAGLFGWQASTAMPMPEIGTYQLFRQAGADIGGMMKSPMPDMRPYWLPYFGTNSIARAIATITEKGGTVLHGPQEVPGGAFIAMARDPQGAHFAVVGPA